MFDVTVIPVLIIVDANNGEVLTRKGRAIPSDDPEGDDFPWRPKEFLEIIEKGNLINKEGATKTWDEVASESDYLGLYFSAQWVNSL